MRKVILAFDFHLGKRDSDNLLDDYIINLVKHKNARDLLKINTPSLEYKFKPGKNHKGDIIVDIGVPSTEDFHNILKFYVQETSCPVYAYKCKEFDIISLEKVLSLYNKKLRSDNDNIGLGKFVVDCEENSE